MAKWFRKNDWLLGRLRTLHAVLGAGTPALLHAGGVERAADNMITNSGQILHATAPNEHNRVLLQIVALVRNIRNNFVAVREPNFRHLADCRVRLLRRAG